MEIDLFKVAKLRVKETFANITQKSLMMNLNKSLSTLNYQAPSVNEYIK